VKTIDLTYCTNVHALADLTTWRRTLGFFGPEVRRHLGWSSMPMGLWWQASLAEALADENLSTGSLAAESVAAYLGGLGLRAFTCNAFPYGHFHQDVVKTQVYVPDWASPERLAYTQTCARLMATLTPPGGFASISTLPLGWRLGFDPAKLSAAIAQLLLWVEFARDLEDATGKRIALGLEPEPGCALERTPQVIAFWQEHLRPAARARHLDETTLARYLGLCYDTCHQAVQFEGPEAALGALAAAGIAIHKMQLSSALEFPPDPEKKSLAVRNSFAEPKFLHQTRVEPGVDPAAGHAPSSHSPTGGAFARASADLASANIAPVRDFDDLPEALAEAPWNRTWRTHYHLPLQAESLLDAQYVRTTRDDMLRAYRYALKHDLCHHFEVETYTWSVLPPAERPQSDAALAEAMAREIAFVLSHTPADVAVRDAKASP
jgi:hypothetical protein